ncbi:hypothetical protein F4803DRAFT_565726 [Xylaria telfairii]|nr:hypothetical protein F4803DRAFT_565726 [Xylaria telfairii]
MSSLPTADCLLCFETKPLADFPQAPVTPHCQHTATSCLVCVASFLESQSRNGFINRLSCPECSGLLTYDGVQDFATSDLFERYKTYAIEQLISNTYHLVWCPLCGTQMAQYEGAEQGITLCLACNRQFCSRHQVSWHAEFTCDEYEIFLTDPSFRSKAQLAAAEQEAYGLQDEQLRQLIQDADDNFAHSLMNERQASQARLEKKARERRLAEERAVREAQRQREREEAERVLERKRQEEKLTGESIRRKTKPCPGCRVPIEKNGGWFLWSAAGW